ncbi:MAG: hypothetical protein JW941_06200, partial [Candidatus Coatesbacteria bacterium]|nr:hypothetical protein [Candidatus Coatesbacteria bacterium]
ASADSIIVIPNDRLFSLTNEITYYEALKLRDDLLTNIMSSVAELVFLPSEVPIDFGSIRAVIRDGGMMVVAEATGSGINKVDKIVDNLLRNSLVDHPPMESAQAILLITTIGYEVMKSDEVELKSRITSAVSPRARIFCGTKLDEKAGDTITATLIATQFGNLLEPQAEVMALERIYSIEQVNRADLSHPIHTPSYRRLKSASEKK